MMRPEVQNNLLATALAIGDSMTVAARKAGISLRTAHRRVKSPKFREQLAQRRFEATDEAIGVLSRAASKAAARLEDLIENQSAQVSVSVCRAILETLLKLRQEQEFETRVRAIEEKLAATIANQPAYR